MPPGVLGQCHSLRVHVSSAWAHRRGRVHVRQPVSGWEGPAREDEHPDGTQAGGQVLRAAASHTTGVRVQRDTELPGGRFWFGNARDRHSARLQGQSLQLLPVLRQVALALTSDADQPPSRPQAPA